MPEVGSWVAHSPKPPRVSEPTLPTDSNSKLCQATTKNSVDGPGQGGHHRRQLLFFLYYTPTECKRLNMTCAHASMSSQGHPGRIDGNHQRLLLQDLSSDHLPTLLNRGLFCGTLSGSRNCKEYAAQRYHALEPGYVPVPTGNPEKPNKVGNRRPFHNGRSIATAPRVPLRRDPHRCWTATRTR